MNEKKPPGGGVYGAVQKKKPPEGGLVDRLRVSASFLAGLGLD
jgi:hypothetical protein